MDESMRNRRNWKGITEDRKKWTEIAEKMKRGKRTPHRTTGINPP